MLINPHHSDQELLQRLVTGCERSFEVIFKKYHGYLYHYSFRVFRDKCTADEIVHKTFIKIWDRKEKLVDVTSIKSYLYAVNRSLVVEELRSIARDKRLAERLAHRIVSSYNPVEEDMIYHDLKEITRQAIEQLPPKRKEIFKLSRHHGFTHKEIACKLNISENTVKVSVYKSLQQIRDYLTLNADVSLVLVFAFLFL